MPYKDPEKRREYNREWRKRNPEYMREYNREWRRKNPESFREWVKRNRERINARNRERRKNVGIRLSDNVSGVMRRALKENKAGRHWETLVGYTLKDLMSHLETQFDENMFWNNYGSYWHIDHRKPISLFNFKTVEDPEFKECWALSNLQPLEAIANKRKSNRYRE